jgi:hypothetical protein
MYGKERICMVKSYSARVAHSCSCHDAPVKRRHPTLCHERGVCISYLSSRQHAACHKPPTVTSDSTLMPMSLEMASAAAGGYLCLSLLGHLSLLAFRALHQQTAGVCLGWAGRAPPRMQADPQPAQILQGFPGCQRHPPAEQSAHRLALPLLEDCQVHRVMVPQRQLHQPSCCLPLASRLQIGQLR